MKLSDKQQRRLMWVIGILFVMSILPGEGWKTPDSPQAVVTTKYSCTQDSDCPRCVGAGLADDETTFLGELNTQRCTNGMCELSEYCLIWDCGQTQTQCSSIKQSILENTLEKINKKPIILFAAILFIAAFVMLGKK